MNVVNLDRQIQQAIQHLPDENYMLGRTLMQPFKPSNSGSRALMYSVHNEHFMVLSNGEVPLIQTGYETEFGECSTSYVTSDAEYEIVAKIYKFTFNKNHYFLILRNTETDEYDVIERVSYRYNTESYGYMWDNSRIDVLNVGDIIQPGQVIKTSVGYDQYGNKENGVNLLTLYLSSSQNMEDSLLISESAAKKMETCLIKSTDITINDNDILLNLYGNSDVGGYKAFPDIGEQVQDGIFCAIRRVENRDILFALSQQRQRDIMLSDRPILIDGWVCDIDVYCNNPASLGDSIYNSQLYKYYQERIEFCRRVNEIVGPIAMNKKMSYALQKLYGTCRDTINGREYFKERQFNNVILKVAIMHPLMMEHGDKAADRYGGKGVVSKVVPDEEMPILDNGMRVEIIKNQSTCINRENIGQLHEQSIAFINMRMIDYMKAGLADGSMTYQDCFKLWYDYVRMVDTDQAEYSLMYVDQNSESDCEYFMTSVFNDGIVISMQPFTTSININTIRAIYDRFPWIKPYTVQMPVKDSNGNLRFVPARRPLIAGKIYNYRLKQYGEEKFSVTSLSATNLKNLNTRSKASKVFEAKYTKTPIMFGFMESADMAHLGMQYVVMNLMLYANSPQARRLFEQLLIGDPYEIDIQLDQYSKNRNAEIINALLKTLGLRLRFVKTPKKKHYLVKNIMYKTVPNSEWDPSKHGIRDIIGYDDVPDLRYATAMQRKSGSRLYDILMTRGVDELGQPIYKTNINAILEAFEQGRIDIGNVS